MKEKIVNIWHTTKRGYTENAWAFQVLGFGTVITTYIGLAGLAATLGAIGFFYWLGRHT